MYKPNTAEEFRTVMAFASNLLRQPPLLVSTLVACKGVLPLIYHSYRHAAQTLTATLETLATHPGDARNCLLAAYPTLQTLTEDDLPRELRLQWRWVRQQMSKYLPHECEDNQPLRMQNRTAVKIAKALYGMYLALREGQAYR